MVSDSDFCKLTKEQLENQIQDKTDHYLMNAEIGDWVYSDGDMLISESVISDWTYVYQNSDEEEHKRNLEILDKFAELKSSD